MRTRGLRILPVLTGVTLTAAITTTGCREEDPVRTTANQGSLPTMVTTDVDTYVSDSGYVKYHAVTDIWEVYDDTLEPYWRFPRPLVIDILAPGMKPDSHIECDSALYKTSKRLFRFDGNVTAVNVAKDTFLTQQLFWDQNATEFYTDSFIHIVKADRVLEGYGFRSNEKMTEYSISRPTAILPVSAFKKNQEQEERTKESRDSLNESEEVYPDAIGRPTPIPASQRNGGFKSIESNVNTMSPGGETAPGIKR